MNIRKQLDYIQVLRGIAIIGVIFVHAFQEHHIQNQIHWVLNKISEQGARGVQLFYMISAYSLYYNYFMKNNFSVKKYLFKRVLRIAPLFYCSYILYNLIYPLIVGQSINISLSETIFALTFTAGLAPFTYTTIVPGGWSVYVEMLFYILLPLFFMSRDYRNNVLLFFILNIAFGTSILFINYYTNNQYREFFFLSIYAQLPVFILGILAFYHDFNLIDKKNKFYENLLHVSLVLVILLKFIIVKIPDYFVFSCAFYFLIIAFKKIKFNSLFWKAMAQIGNLSFGIYLFHFFVLYILSYLNLHSIFTNVYLDAVYLLITTSLLSILISYLSYQFIEFQFIKFAQRRFGL